MYRANVRAISVVGQWFVMVALASRVLSLASVCAVAHLPNHSVRRAPLAKQLERDHHPPAKWNQPIIDSRAGAGIAWQF